MEDDEDQTESGKPAQLFALPPMPDSRTELSRDRWRLFRLSHAAKGTPFILA